VHLIVQFIFSFALALVIWSVANTKSVAEAGLAARRFAIFAVPFALVTFGLSRLLGTFVGSLAVFFAVFVAYLAYAYVIRTRYSESGSTIPFALIFAVVWSLLSW
jgi:hypothetical protein